NISQSINKPPSFDGNNYSYKTRMAIFIQSLDYQLWNIITNGPEIPTKIVDGQRVLKLDNEYNDHGYKLLQLNAKAKHMIFCTLSPSEFNRVSSLDSAKEMWDRLMVTYEDTSKEEKEEKEVICYECDKPGHIRPECPKLKKKKDKKKAMIATWSDSDESSSEDEESEEVTNISFMAMEDDCEVTTSSLSYNELQCEYDELLDVLKDLNREY
ncbi:LOW QUALITY PROTEIN: zf-CCHC domain-containing protein/DUF4219 domain-containing protein, partial [Cephalotus follicularis]